MIEFLGRVTATALVLAGLCALADYLTPYDSTDPVGGRSGLAVRQDAATGCEYLTTAFGRITPRVNGSGQHVGCRP